MIDPIKAHCANLTLRQVILLRLLPVSGEAQTSGIHQVLLSLGAPTITRQGVDYELRLLEKAGLLTRSEVNGYVKISRQGTKLLNVISHDETQTQKRRGQHQAA